MQSAWRIGSVFNIPLYIDFSWIFILGLITLLNGLTWGNAYPTWQPVFIWGAGMLTALLLFGSVLLHELGHSLVAKQQGIQVNSITLFLFGGLASIEDEPDTPGHTFQVAIAGPVVSLVLWGVFNVLVWQLPATNPIAFLANYLAQINLVLALFNLIPGLPLDGGQVLKAAVWKMTGDRLSGTRWAIRTGRLLGWAAVIFGVASLLLPTEGNIWLAVLGWFILRSTDRYSQMITLQEALLKLLARDAVVRDFRVLEAGMTLRQFAETYVLNASQLTVYFAAADGRYRGLVEVGALSQVERSQWDVQTLEAILRPLNALVTVQEQTPLAEVINLMEGHHLSFITVLSPAGTVAGTIDRGDVVRAMGQKLNLQISPTVIKQIKEAGFYPPEMPLVRLAQMTVGLLPHQAVESKA